MSTSFATDLYQVMPEGNLFFSPFSIQSALVRAAVGAKSTTRQEFLKALYLSNAQNGTIMGIVRQYEQDLAGLSQVIFEVANRIYAEGSCNFKKEYVNLMAGDFVQVDFIYGHEQVRQQINAWVEQKTHRRIQDLMPDGSLDARTKMAIINAVYFLGRWQKAFDPDETRVADFTRENGSKVSVDMMYQKGFFPYYRDTKVQAVMLPYQGGRLARVYFLPVSTIPSSLLYVEDYLVEGEFDRIIANMEPTEVRVFVPKFKLSWGTYDITRDLKMLGIEDAFSMGADFSGIEPSRDLYISGVYHQAWLEDTEEGSEAAAATGVVMRSKGIDPTPTFLANRPFMFAIIDRQNGNQPIFMGRLADPSK